MNERKGPNEVSGSHVVLLDYCCCCVHCDGATSHDENGLPRGAIVWKCLLTYMHLPVVKALSRFSLTNTNETKAK